MARRSTAIRRCQSGLIKCRWNWDRKERRGEKKPEEEPLLAGVDAEAGGR